MTDPKLAELADRLESAGAPDRELDWRIAEALGYRCTLENTPGIPGRHIQRFYGCGPLGDVARLAKKLLPRFTASLDAAMTLVPEGCLLRQMNFSAPCADDRKWHLNLYGGREGEDCFVGAGASPALALCAAALRARSTGRG